MIRYEDECVDCSPEMGCFGSACPYSNVLVYVCDDCGEEFYNEEDVVLLGDNGSCLCLNCYNEIICEDEDE